MVTSTDASESIYVSARFDFEWRLPATWEFVPRNEVALADASFPATRSTDEFARDLTASAKKDGHEVTTAAPVMFPRTENGATGCRHRTAADLDLQEQEAVLRGENRRHRGAGRGPDLNGPRRNSQHSDIVL